MGTRMGSAKRMVLVASLLALLPAVTGCSGFDPDKLDVFGLNEKKKLPGDRRPLFPEGVPGVTQGVPPELVKGHQAPPEEAAAVETSAPAVAEKPKPKPAAKPRVVRKPAPVEPAGEAPASSAAPAASPWPDAQPPRQQSQSSSPWPSSQPAQSAPSQSPWPDAPPAGTFSR
jgi:hypothetical protein